ncbi:MAG TPA: hypothetical protein VKX17_04550 [Planctomycetota bacterium]|nr:hypothetical protein [Planctomycetota bacterium]
MNLKLEELEKLPHFLIRDRFQRAEEIYLTGVFAPRLESWQNWCFAYALADLNDVRQAWIEVLWEAPDSSSAVVRYDEHSDNNEMAVGNSIPCGTLKLDALLLILDLDTTWSERTFKSEDAWTYESSPGWRTTLQPAALPPPDAKNVKKRSKGWDHEHCAFTFCWATISEHENTSAYVATSCFGREMWVCPKCYEANVVPHKLPASLCMQ